MARNLSILLVRQFLILLARGIGAAAIMLVITLFAVFRGLWDQSHFVATAWLRQLAFARMDDHVDGSMYWSIRIIAFVLELASSVVLAHLLTWLVELALRR